MQVTLKNGIWAATAAIALGSGSALAQENNTGFYAGGGVGQFNLEIDGLDGVDEAVEGLDADDTAWQVFVGWRFSQHFAVEAAYLDFGQPNDRFTATGSSGDYRVGLSGFAPSFIATIPLGPVELFGRIGYYFYDVDLRADFDDLGGDVFSSSDSGEDLIYGGGVGVTLFERLNARLEYEVVDLNNADDASAFWLTASWRF